VRECHTLKPTLPYGKRELADILSRALITILKEWQEICHTHRVQSYSNSLKHPNVLLFIYGLMLLFSFKGFNFMLFYVIYWIIRKLFVTLQPKAASTGYASAIQANLIALGLHRPCHRINNNSYGSNRFQSFANSSASDVRPGQEPKWAQGVEGRTLPPLFG
jgi:hypothetical protein